MIKINNLSKFYGQHLILENINLSFKPGMVYGIVGANGAGKTTLFKCICQLTDYLGSIESDYDVLKNHIGYLPTDPYTLSRITGYEYLQLFSIARQGSITEINEMNIFHLPLDQYVSTYSTGMLKKIALQAVLLQKNDIIILDEPFNGVDIQSNIIITELIHLLKEKGKLVLISSHIFETLDKVCDRIFLLNNKQIESTYSPDQFSNLESKLKSFVIDTDFNDLDL